MKKYFLILIFAVCSVFATTFSEPKPTFENPRKWVVKISTNNKSSVNHTINAVNNVLKAYPQEALKVAMVFYASGIRVLKKDYDKQTISRIKSLMEYEIEIIACKNTMDTMRWSKKDLIDDISYVQTGISEVIERVINGWIDVTPY